jgi:hypothetical protein
MQLCFNNIFIIWRQKESENILQKGKFELSKQLENVQNMAIPLQK